MKKKYIVPFLSMLVLTSCENKTYGKIILNANGGTFKDNVKELEIKGLSGKTVTENEDLVPKNGELKFKGWYENAECKGNSLKLVFPYLVTYTVYAGWAEKVNVKYYVGLEEYAIDTGYQGDDFVLKEYETDEIFFGWYYDKEFKEKCNIYSYPNTDIELYAKIEENPTISLHYSESKVINHKDKAGSKIEKQFEVPSKEGYKFIGWYTKEDKQFYFDYMPGTSLDLYPKFLKKVTISFETHGGTTVTNLVGYQGEKIIDSIPLTFKNNYYLDGWYIDSIETGTKFEFDIFPDDDMVLYAKWVINPCITFDYETGKESTAYDTIYLPQNSVIPPLPEPVLEGHRFIGWYTIDDSGNYQLFVDKIMPNRNIELIGRFTELRRATITTIYQNESTGEKEHLWDSSIVLITDTIDGEWWNKNYSIPSGYVLSNIYINDILPENIITLPYNPDGDVNIVVAVVKEVKIRIFDDTKLLLTLTGGEGMSYDINLYMDKLNKDGYVIEGFYEEKTFTNAYAMKMFPREIKTGPSLTLDLYIRYNEVI